MERESYRKSHRNLKVGKLRIIGIKIISLGSKS